MDYFLKKHDILKQINCPKEHSSVVYWMTGLKKYPSPFTIPWDSSCIQSFIESLVVVWRCYCKLRIVSCLFSAMHNYKTEKTVHDQYCFVRMVPWDFLLWELQTYQLISKIPTCGCHLTTDVASSHLFSLVVEQSLHFLLVKHLHVLSMRCLLL